MTPEAQPQEFLSAALHAIAGEGDWKPVLDDLPVPVYTTDADGAVTYWNRACVDFAGREPQLGSDRWCVTWQLLSIDGEPMRHEECPMAEAIKTRREVRGKVAIAMRPDGSRRAFAAYPTPLFGESGQLSGAVNVLIDISADQAEELDQQASRCRRLARSTNDSQAASILSAMADRYRAMADMLKART